MMNTVFRSLLKAMLFAGCLTGIPAQAETGANSQLYFVIAPNANDPVWQTAGVKFEKSGVCDFTMETSLSTQWPPKLVVGGGNARAPLFVAGDAINTSSQGTTTILWWQNHLNQPAPAIVCRGSILANGIDVTINDAGRVQAYTAQHLSTQHPPSVYVHLDPVKLASVIAPPAGRGTVYKSGFLNLKLTWTVDFDTGTTGAKAGADVWFAATDWQHLFFTPQNGARISAAHPTAGFGDRPQQYGDCADDTLVATAQPASLKVGNFYCVRTSEGRLAEFEIAQVTGNAALRQPYELALHYTVWSN